MGVLYIASDSKPAVSIQNLVKKFGNFAAVDDITLTANGGSLLTLLGPSGCGKTTMLRCISGLEDPDEGEIIIGNKPVFSSKNRINVPTEKRRIGMVFQSYAIWPHLTVFGNIAFPLKIRGMANVVIKKKVSEALAKVRMEGFEDRPATDLSGGQQQRIALARALVHDPEVLLLDEPLSNLDANLRDIMRVELRELQRNLGTTAIYVTHDQIEALSISDVVAVMSHGKVVGLGTPREIYQSPPNKFVALFIGKTNFIKAKPKASNIDGYDAFETSIGLIFCSGSKATRNLADCLIATKAEAIHLHEEVPQQKMNVFEGRVEMATYLGGYTEYQLSINGESIRAYIPSEEVRAEKGVKVYVELPPKHCVVIQS